MTGFTFTNVSQKYGNLAVINNLSLDVVTGESICLLGPSGSGKTTILRLLAGIEQPTKGEVYINGMLASDKKFHLPLEQRGIGVLFQDYALFPHLNVMENVLFGLHKPKSLTSKNRAVEVLSQAGVLKLSYKYPENLSGGEQQRVALARALAPNPQLMLMDEPFSSLDVQLRDRLRVLTSSLMKKGGRTNVIVTHDPEDAMRLADRIAVMLNGEIVQCDTPKNIYEKPITAEVANLLGPVNTSKYIDILNASTGFNDIASDALICVRPHAIKLKYPSHLPSGREVFIKGVLNHVRKIGSEWRGIVNISPKIIWDIYSSTPLPEDGSGQHHFCINEEDLMIFND